jgi:hypothetical protein
MVCTIPVVTEERTVSVFRVEEYALETSSKWSCCLHTSFFDLEKRKQCDPPKHQSISLRLHGVTSQEILFVTAVADVASGFRT